MVSSEHGHTATIPCHNGEQEEHSNSIERPEGAMKCRSKGRGVARIVSSTAWYGSARTSVLFTAAMR